MKYSQFNSIIPYEDKFALYNSFNQKVIFLVPELKELLKAAIVEGIDNLYEFHPTFYNYLLEQEYIIGDSVDEVGKVKELVKSVDENTREFLLTINPTMNCNFKCWYCYETHVKESRLETDIIARVQKFIEKTTNKPMLDDFSLSFFGGEPLLYFKKVVAPIIDYFTQKCTEKNINFQIGFTTNGFLINEDFISFFNNRNIKCGLQITLDGYKEDHDSVRFVNAKRGSYEEIIKNVRLLIENHFFVRLRINYTDKNIYNISRIVSEFEDISQDIKNDFLFIDFHRVWQNAQGDDITDVLNENIDIIRNKGFKVQSGNLSLNSVRNSCYADKRNSATINYNGDIYKCTARDFTKSNRAGYINEEGELIWENDYLNKRMEVKFKNKPCLTCKIMPLCNGGCSQHALESFIHGKEYCVFDGDEQEKDKVIKIKIDEILYGNNKHSVNDVFPLSTDLVV